VPDLRRFEDFAVGDSAAIDRVVLAHDVTRYVELTGDDNPIHLSDDFASSLGVDRRIVHGMLTAGFVSAVIGTLLPGPGALWLSETFRFRAPVHVDDQIRVEVRVRYISPASRVLVLDVMVTKQDGAVVLDGDANVQVLDGSIEAGAPTGLDVPRRQVGASARPADRSNTKGCAVITGSGRGIGAAIAARLAADGMAVMVNYRHDQAQAESTAGAITALGGEAATFGADVSDPTAVDALFHAAVDRFGPVTVLVNNAGTGIGRRPLLETTWEEMERHLATHLRASFLCVQAVLPGMVERRSGRIINITSEAAYGLPAPEMTGYVVAKAALAALTHSIALEAGPHGITANAVAPGMVDTDLVTDVARRTKLALAAQSPLRRLATASAVADAVAFLAGPSAAEVTGQTIHLSGGKVMS
jgi:3-oxoacyl-[acyl-carrier protein] reductase